MDYLGSDEVEIDTVDAFSETSKLPLHLRDVVPPWNGKCIVYRWKYKGRTFEIYDIFYIGEGPHHREANMFDDPNEGLLVLSDKKAKKGEGNRLIFMKVGDMTKNHRIAKFANKVVKKLLEKTKKGAKITEKEMLDKMFK
jgi:hypothetical protein